MIKNDQILRLLQAHIDTEIETVAAQGRDHLDFRDVHIGSLVTLVKRAYMVGHGHGYEEGFQAGADTEPAYETVD
jgi:hypothetical protein